MIDPAEYALYQLERTLDDLACLLQTPQFASAVANHDWPAVMRRIVDMKGDADEIVASQKIAAE